MAWETDLDRSDPLLGPNDLFTVLPSGEDHVQVSVSIPAVPEARGVHAFAWAPDGSRLAYRADEEVDERIELFTVLPTGRGRVKVSGALVPEGDVHDFLWSPTSTNIVYIADPEVEGQRELYATLPTGDDAVNVSTLGSGEVVRIALTFGDGGGWAPDGTSFSFLGDTEFTPETVRNGRFVTGAEGGGAIAVAGPYPPR